MISTLFLNAARTRLISSMRTFPVATPAASRRIVRSASFGVTEMPLVKPDMMFLLKIMSFLKKYSFSSQFRLAAPVSSAIDPAKALP